MGRRAEQRVSTAQVFVDPVDDFSIHMALFLVFNFKFPHFSRRQSHDNAKYASQQRHRAAGRSTVPIRLEASHCSLSLTRGRLARALSRGGRRICVVMETVLLAITFSGQTRALGLLHKRSTAGSGATMRLWGLTCRPLSRCRSKGSPGSLNTSIRSHHFVNTFAATEDPPELSVGVPRCGRRARPDRIRRMKCDARAVETASCLLG